MSANIFLIVLMICCASCSCRAQKIDDTKSHVLPPSQKIEKRPNVGFDVLLKDSVFNYGDKIFLTLSVTNISSDEQKLLFNKPRVSTGGPWETTGNITDMRTGKSVLKYTNRTILSSQIYTEDQLRDNFYFLKPGQTISGIYELNDIVVVNAPNSLLPKGAYRVQLFYYGIPSREVIIKIR